MVPARMGSGPTSTSSGRHTGSDCVTVLISAKPGARPDYQLWSGAVQALGIHRLATKSGVVAVDGTRQPSVRRDARQTQLFHLRSCNVPNARSIRLLASGLLAQRM